MTVDVRPRALFVDDDEMILRGVARYMLRIPEWETVFVLGGSEGLEAISSARFDVVLSDFQMPNVTGAELLLKVKLEHPSTFRVLMTATPPPDYPRFAQALLIKPFDFEELRGVLNRVNEMTVEALVREP
ncbi:MAG: response regulator [Kofleriaceae bacterium]